MKRTRFMVFFLWDFERAASRHAGELLVVEWEACGESFIVKRKGKGEERRGEQGGYNVHDAGCVERKFFE